MIGTITYQQEKLVNIFKEVYPIFIEHYHEISHFKDIEFEPNVEEYLKAEDLGFLKIYTAREEEVLIGYCFFLIRYNFHYKSSLQAQEDIIYIRKENRGFGKDFIRWCDDELRELGVQVVKHHIKFAHDWSKILLGMGYEKEDMVLVKRLDKGV